METINHYGGDTPYEAIKVIEAWNLGFCLGNTIKYISRAGRKNPGAEVEDLEKAKWYLERRIKQIREWEPKEDPRALPIPTKQDADDELNQWLLGKARNQDLNENTD